VWDIGRPQPAFVRLAEEGRLTGRLLDVGCGTGENALLAASRGADVTGIDIAPAAIARARAKASERGLAARFEVADAFDPGRLRLSVGTVIDSGVFHVFGDDDRARYVASLAAVLRPGGACYLLCFSDREPGTWGPRCVRAEELRAAFSDGWASGAFVHRHVAVLLGVLAAAVDLGSPRTLRTACHYQRRPKVSGTGPFA
jgi:SAM-dependent methyltransferase